MKAEKPQADQKTRFNITLKYGAMYSAFLVLMHLTFHYMNLSQSQGLTLVNIALIGTALYLTANDFNKRHHQGNMAFNQTFGFSIMMVMWGSIFLAAYLYIFFMFIDPSYLEMANRGITDPAQQAGAHVLALINVFTYVFWGMITAAVTSAMVVLIKR